MNKKTSFANALASLQALPSPRGAALQMIQIARRDTAPFEEIVRVARADPALCGRLIHAANRLRVDVWSPTGALEVAVQRLGLAATRQIALGFSLIGEHRSGNCSGFDYENFWNTSLLRGLAAQTLAQRFRSADPSEAFVLGLLLEIGKLALAGAQPDTYARILAQGKPAEAELRAAERAHFGIDHGELAAVLMEQWMLPSETIRALRDFFTPTQAGSGSTTAHWKLPLAEAIAHAALAPLNNAAAWTHVALLMAGKAGIEPAVLEEIAQAVAIEAAEWAPLLRLPVPRAIKLDFNAYADPASGTSTDRSVTAESSDPKMRVLLIDDSEDELLLLRPVLETNGYLVSTADNAEQSLESIVDAPPDIVITDWQMPGMSGPELCRVLRATRIGARLHLIVRTGKTQDEDLVAAIHAGANDFVSKSSTDAVLMARLHAGANAARRRGARAMETAGLARCASDLAVLGLT